MSGPHTAMSEPRHTVLYRVIYGDTDAAGVVYNANYLRYFEIARTEMMREAGMSYRAIEDMGFVLPVTESYIRFKAPARYDDLLYISASLPEASRLTCRFHYAIHRDGEDGRRVLLVKGFTCHACITRQGKLAPFPEAVAGIIAGLAGKPGLTKEKS